MGHPKQVEPPRTGSRRREFIKRSGATSVAPAAAAPPLPRVAQAVDPTFEHGVASGDPPQDGVFLWTRVTPATPKADIPLTCVVATDPGLRNLVQRGTVRTGPQRDYTAKVDVDDCGPAPPAATSSRPRAAAARRAARRPCRSARPTACAWRR